MKPAYQKYFSNYFFQQILFVLIILIFFLLVILPNFTAHNEDGNLITITYADNISQAHKILIKKFNNEYKGRIKVETINLPFSKFSTNERKELLARALRSKSDKIDIFAVDLIWVHRFAKWSEPINESDLNGLENKLLKYSLASCFFNDSLVAIPLYIDISLMFYREDILKKLHNYKIIEKELQNSITWENFIKLGKRMKKLGYPFYIYPAESYEGLICSLTELILNMEPEFFNHGINYNNGTVKNALGFLVDLVQKQKLTPYQATGFKGYSSWEYFIKSNAVFLRGWPGYERYKREAVKKYNFKGIVKKAPLPHLKGSKPISVYGGWNLMISKFSNHKKEALEFIKFLLREDSQKIMYQEGGYLPVLKQLYEDKSFVAKYKDLKFYKNLLNNGVHRPFLKDYTRISDILAYYANKAIKGEISVDKALNEVDQNIQSKSIIIK